MVDKDKRKVDFLLNDLNMQRVSLERSIILNEDIIKQTQMISHNEVDPAEIEKLIQKWIEVVDLLDSKLPMLKNAIKTRDRENADFRDRVLRSFELTPVSSEDINRELQRNISSLPINTIFESFCSKKTLSIEHQQMINDWIQQSNCIVNSRVRNMILEHFSERGIEDIIENRFMKE